MKKLILSVVAGVGLMTSFGQTTIATEDFANDAPSWVIESLTSSSEVFFFIDGDGIFTTGANNSVIVQGFDTDAPSPQPHDGHAQMTSSAYDCSANSTVVFQMEEVYLGGGNNDAERFIEVSTDSTNWTTVYQSIAPAGDAGAGENEIVSVNISDVAAGEATVYIRFRFVSEFDSYWIFDDMALIEPAGLGAEVLAAEMNQFTSGQPVISYGPSSANYGAYIDVKNIGSETITSIDIEYSFDGGTNWETASATGLDIEAFGTATVTLSNILTTPNPAFATGMFRLTNINGTPDGDLTDNNAEVDFTIYDGDFVYTKKPVLEVFTASSCPPCRPGNVRLHQVMDTRADDEYTFIKFQQNFPGVGDPYCTQEAISRRNAYSINSIPRLEIDGGWDGNPGGMAVGDYLPFLTNPGIASISGEYTIDEANQTVDYTITVTPSFNFPNNVTSLHVAIFEGLTENNVENNGETEFEHVMKKLPYGASGLTLSNLVGGRDTVITGSYTFNGNYRLPANASDEINHATEHSVEEFSDLGVIAYIQHNDRMDVYQSEYMTATVGIADQEKSIYGITTFPNPFSNELKVRVNANQATTAEVKVVDGLGKVVYLTSEDLVPGLNGINLNLSDLATGIYNVSVEANGSTETITVSKF